MNWERLIDDLGARLERLGTPRVALLAALLLTIVATCDYLTGIELSFSLFYLLPVALMTWAAGLRPGLAAVVTSTFVWLLVEKAGGSVFSNETIVYWNALVRGGFFTVVCLLLYRLRVALGRERDLARTDALTGAWNKRFFIELLELEVLRYARERRDFTLVYLDLDNFKQVNDRQGHGAGDAMLRTVVELLRRHLRRTDFVARLGGDEFALLLPDTRADAAAALLHKLHATLNDEMTARGSPVRFSVGALHCTGPSPSANELLGAADALMYHAKKGGKNRIVSGTWPLAEAVG